MSREGDFSRDAPTSSTSPGALRGPRGPPSCHFCLPAKSGRARRCVTWKWQPTALEKALLQNNPHPHHRDLPPPRPGPKPISPASDGELGGFGGPRVVSAGAELSEPPPGATQGSLPRNQRLLLLGGSCGFWARWCSRGGSPGMAEPGWGRCPPVLPSLFPPRFPDQDSRHSFILAGTALFSQAPPLNLGCCWGGQHYSCARCFRGARTHRATGDTRNGPAEVPGGLGVPWVPPEPGATRRGTAPCLETGGTLRSPPHGGGSRTGAVPPPYRAWGDTGDISTVPTGPPRGAHHYGG